LKLNQRNEEKALEHFLKTEEKRIGLTQKERAREAERLEMLEKIEEDNQRSLRLKQEKAELMQARQLMKQQIDRDKQQIIQDFEKMKRGQIAPNELAGKYGYSGSIHNKSETSSGKGSKHTTKKSKPQGKSEAKPKPKPKPKGNLKLNFSY